MFAMLTTEEGVRVDLVTVLSEGEATRSDLMIFGTVHEGGGRAGDGMVKDEVIGK